MTCVVGSIIRVNNEPKVVIGADKRILHSTGVIAKAGTFCKLIKFPNFVVGVAGAVAINLYIQELKRSQKEFLKMRNLKDAYEFTMHVFEALNERIKIDEDSGTGLGQLLIATPKALYEGCNFDTVPMNEYCSIGSGCQIALGAMAVQYPQVANVDELKEAVAKTLQVVVDHHSECGPPFDIVEVV